MLGALAMVAAGFLFSAPAAQAYIINCSNITGGGGAYPYDGSAQKCGTANTSKANNMAGEIYGYTIRLPNAYVKLSSVDAKFYIFKNTSEYDTFFDERELSPPSGTTSADWAHKEPAAIGNDVFGLTWKVSGEPKWTVVFENSYNSVSIDSVANVAYVTAHESGHWLEYSYRSHVSSSDHTAANSTMFMDLLTQDESNFRDLTNCGTGGVFNGKADFSGTYICGGTSHNQLPMNSPYNGSPAPSNTAVLSVGYSSIFNDRSEIFASEIARASGNSDDAPKGVDYYFKSHRFGCTLLLVDTLSNSGNLPTVDEMEDVTVPGGADAECPTSGSGWSLPE